MPDRVKKNKEPTNGKKPAPQNNAKNEIPKSDIVKDFYLRPRVENVDNQTRP